MYFPDPVSEKKVVKESSAASSWAKDKIVGTLTLKKTGLSGTIIPNLWTHPPTPWKRQIWHTNFFLPWFYRTFSSKRGKIFHKTVIYKNLGPLDPTHQHLGQLYQIKPREGASVKIKFYDESTWYSAGMDPSGWIPCSRQYSSLEVGSFMLLFTSDIIRLIRFINKRTCHQPKAKAHPPAGISHLDASLTNVDGNDLSHGDPLS